MTAELPPVERTIAAYGRATLASLRRQPLRHTWRILRRRRRERVGSFALAASADAVEVPAFLRPPSYSYRGYHGPWLEEHFYREWPEGPRSGATYLPVFFDSLFFHAQCHAYLPGEFAARYRALWAILERLGASDRAYFTVVGMYDFPVWEWHLFPRNIVVASSEGCGDLTIPLLKGDRPFRRRPLQDIRVSFMGSLAGVSDTLGVRSEMKAAFAGAAHFGAGSDWESVMARSCFSLCPRGQSPTSFRLFEALSVASVPVYLWRDRCSLPFADGLDWSEFALVFEAGQMAAARERIQSMTPAAIERMRDRIAQIYADYFSYRGACEQLRRRTAAIGSRRDAEALTANRS